MGLRSSLRWLPPRRHGDGWDLGRCRFGDGREPQVVLEGPFVEFERDVNAYLEQLGASLQQTRARVAIACYLASALSLIGIALTWRTPAGRVA